MVFTLLTEYGVDGEPFPADHIFENDDIKDAARAYDAELAGLVGGDGGDGGGSQ